MNNDLENISTLCDKEQVDFNSIPKYYNGSYLELKKEKYSDSIQSFETDGEKILVVEIGKNVIYRVSFTKGQIDVFCATDVPIINEELLTKVEKELVRLLNKKRMELFY